MTRALTAWLLLAAAAGCGNNAPPSPASSTTASGEPVKIRVLHVLLSFRGAAKAEESVTRTQDEAEVLAKEILARAKRGEDFSKLIKDYTADHGDGSYTLVNYGHPAGTGDVRRESFVPGFTKVAFTLRVGDVGLTPYHPKESPYGYHIIKRIE